MQEFLVPYRSSRNRFVRCFMLQFKTFEVWKKWKILSKSSRYTRTKDNGNGNNLLNKFYQNHQLLKYRFCKCIDRHMTEHQKS